MHVELTPGVVTILPAWKLDAVYCGGLTVGRPTGFVVGVNAGSNVPKCAEVKILSWAGFSVISRADGDRELRFLVADRGGAAAVPGSAS